MYMYVLSKLSSLKTVSKWRMDHDGSREIIHTRLLQPSHRGCDAANLLDALHMYVAWQCLADLAVQIVEWVDPYVISD